MLLRTSEYTNAIYPYIYLYVRVKIPMVVMGGMVLWLSESMVD